jgi:D-alanyl-D-alanine carboxypeptidase (penicillin-binding protein 5/6)
MAFYSQKIQRKLPGDWTFVIVTDRADLDEQISGTFKAAGVVSQVEGDQCHAGSGAQLAALLRGNHRYVFTLIHKFNQPGKIYSERDYTYNNIKQPNRNRLLFIDPSVDGVKTGHTDAAGYCLIASSRREQPGGGFQRRLLTVVLGTASESARAIESQKLLNYGFANFDVVRLYQKDQSAASYPIWKGAGKEVRAGFTKDVLVTVARGQGDRVKGEIERVQPLVAPLTKGQAIGTLRVKLDDKVIAEQPLVTLDAVAEAGWFGRAWDTIRLWFK